MCLSRRWEKSNSIPIWNTTSTSPSPARSPSVGDEAMPTSGPGSGKRPLVRMAPIPMPETISPTARGCPKCRAARPPIRAEAMITMSCTKRSSRGRCVSPGPPASPSLQGLAGGYHQAGRDAGPANARRGDRRRFRRFLMPRTKHACLAIKRRWNGARCAYRLINGAASPLAGADRVTLTLPASRHPSKTRNG